MNKEAIEKGLEVLSWCQENADEKWMVDHLALVRTHLDQALAKLTEQPPAGELTKEAIELDKMCVSEIVAKYESSHNAITVLKRKFREACESDEWRKSATEFYENGGCPICFSTDEAGCTEGCYLGQLQAKLEESPEQPPAGEFTEKVRKDWDKNIFGGVIFDLCTRLDRSEASRKELLTACRKLVKFCYPDGKWRGWNNMKGILEIMQPIRRLAEKK